ncbi:hypothetical protein WN51_01408 [Melipona quadrifasciata]|uniref:Uncharacterized protein n=1 Tax=Melipona quadrifasciata TaxID=166423 RepID=A0A0M8ZW28_9HYME|nr:hypothetical protein WN51_01408 [Melipona quadrifasciata]
MARYSKLEMRSNVSDGGCCSWRQTCCDGVCCSRIGNCCSTGSGSLYQPSGRPLPTYGYGYDQPTMSSYFVGMTDCRKKIQIDHFDYTLVRLDKIDMSTFVKIDLFELFAEYFDTYRRPVVLALRRHDARQSAVHHAQGEEVTHSSLYSILIKIYTEITAQILQMQQKRTLASGWYRTVYTSLHIVQDIHDVSEYAGITNTKLMSTLNAVNPPRKSCPYILIHPAYSFDYVNTCSIFNMKLVHLDEPLKAGPMITHPSGVPHTALLNVGDRQDLDAKRAATCGSLCTTDYSRIIEIKTIPRGKTLYEVHKL